jgi:CheY-like chemotaxis protein
MEYADVLNEQLLLYNREFKERLTVGELRGRWIWDFVPPDRVRALERHLQSDDFFERVAAIPHSQRVLERLQRRYDVAMPRMNGQQLADRMNLKHPDAPIIFVSGYPKSREILAGLSGRGFRNGYSYLEKPFAGKELLAVIRTELKKLRPLAISR